MEIVNHITAHKPSWIKTYEVTYTFDTLEQAEHCVQEAKSYIQQHAIKEHVGFDLCYIYTFKNTEKAQQFNQTKLNNEGYVEV
jgi:hypothetical protein